MTNGTILFLGSSDLRKPKEGGTIEDAMELTGDALKVYQEVDFVLYGDSLVLKNKYGKTGIIKRKV